MSVATDLAVDIRSIFAPRPDTSVTEWAEANVFLPSKVTDNAGPYSTAHCAYIRELLEDFRDPTVTDSANCFAAQVYKTTAVFVGIGYRIDQQPANVIMVLPTYKQATDFSKDKWQPMVEASPSLSCHKQRDQDKFTILHQQFDNCVLHLIGSGAESSLKGKSAEILIIDEIDDVEEKWAKKGKSGVSMLESRVKSYAGSKVIKTGTPTEITGAIWTAFLEGDRRLFFVTCPECRGKPFAIEFDPEYTKQWFPDVLTAKVVWDGKNADGTYNLKTVKRTAAVECPCCKARLRQERLPAMIANGRWIPTNRNCVTGKISRRLPSMYSPHEKCTLGNLAVKFLENLSKAGGIRAFLNEELAVPHQLKGFTTSENDIRAVRDASPEYLRGEIPKDDVAFLCLTVDYNNGIYHWVTRAWFSDGASALVDYGNVGSWDSLLELSNRSYKTKTTGASYSPLFNFIDSGWRAKGEHGVYAFCLDTSAGRFVPTKGDTKIHLNGKTLEQSDIDHKGRNIKLVRFDEPVLKYDLYFNKIKKIDSKWWLPRNVSTDYEEQLTDEYLKQDNGKTSWQSREHNEHLADAEKQQLIVPFWIESMMGKNAFKVLAERQARKQRTKLTS